MSELYIFIFVLILNLVSIGISFMVHRNLKDCNNRASIKCPVISCPHPNSVCNNTYAPYRCLKFDPGSSTCTGDNVMCMNYDVTDPLTFNAS